MIFNMRAKEVLGVIESDSTELVGSYDSTLKINKIGGVCEQTADERNLFKFESLTAPTNGVLALHESGVAALLEDYMFIGTANSYGGCVVTVANPIKGNGLYSNLFVISGSYTGTIKHKAVDSNGNETTAVAIGTALSLDSTKEYTKFVIAFEEGAVCTDLVLGFKVSKTDYNTFTPYIENVPSPDYPVEIKKSVVSVVRAHGRQLLDLRNGKSGTGEGVNFTNNGDGSYTMTGTATGTVGNMWFKGNYNQVPKDDGSNVYLTLYKGRSYYISDCRVYSSRNNVAVSLAGLIVPKYDFKVTGIRNDTLEKDKTYNKIIYPMIVEGDSLLPWEPYTESVITLSQPIELGGINVQDTIEGGKTKRRFESIIFDGSEDENWGATATNKSGLYRLRCYGFKGAIKRPADSYKKIDMVCDQLNNVTATETYTAIDGISVNSVGELFIYSSKFSTNDVSLWKAHLKANPMTVVYELAEEVIEDLPLTDQIALSCLKTFHGVTYVEFDGEVQPTLNSEYATNLEGAITLQAQADNKIGKANTLVNRAEGESDIFEVRVEHGLVYLYKDDILHGILGANNVITNSETYKTMNVRAEEDADFIALTSAKNNNICYYMNINQIPFTSSHFKEAHYFGGDARFTGRVVGNEHIVGKNLQAQQMVFAQAVEASITLISKGDVTAANNIEAQNELKGKDLHFTNMGINGGAAQPVEWVWDSTLGRWVLCTVQEQGE